MLNLSRKRDETIVLSLDGGRTYPIEILVGESSLSRVRLGITAPEGVIILRKELLEKGKTHETQS